MHISTGFGWLRGLLLASALFGLVPAQAAGVTGDIQARDLPQEARATLRLIQKGGPFPYAKDGVVFGNRERILPRQSRGYYTEYTVKTPGERNRGARRIIAGQGSTGSPSTSGEYYYTDDHYNSFKRIRP
jgi:ribonuclease T1